jgi:hypothetical protein
MLLGGLITLVNLLLSLVVGLKLLAAGIPSGRLAERALGIYFLTTPVLATVCLGWAYGGFVDPRLAVSPATGGLLIGIATVGMAVGACAIYAFLWRTFRPDVPEARLAALAGGGLALLGAALEGLHDGFAVRLDPGLGHWVAWLGRTLPMAWLLCEAIRYHGLLIRRTRIGLADPLVADRFLLWALWSAAGVANLGADVISRLIYAAAGGDAHPDPPELLRAIALGTMTAAMLLGLVSATSLFLAFFPTPGYRRWVSLRAARGSA